MSTVLVTGACGGIGRAICEEFAESGWEVVATDISGTQPPVCSDFHQIDLTSSSERDEFISSLATQGELTALVNNAAIQHTGPVDQSTDEEWEELLALNVTVGLQMARACIPIFKRAGQGSIVNVASVHSVATSPGMAMYAASKGALVALTRAIAVELAPQGIRCNAVLPGAVDTSMLSDGFERSPLGPEAARSRLINTTPMRRIGQPIEIARAIRFLADPQSSSFITGQQLIVDGGATAQLSTE